jgi:hypothetical protein
MADEQRPTDEPQPTSEPSSADEPRPLWPLSLDDQRVLWLTFVGQLASFIVGVVIVGGAIALARAAHADLALLLFFTVFSPLSPSSSASLDG